MAVRTKCFILAADVTGGKSHFMNIKPDAIVSATLHLGSPASTARLAEWLAFKLGRGDVLLLDGPIGAGKTHFCRALIQSLCAASGKSEDVPSPTFTLVQVYELPEFDIWHSDLYRLSSPDQAIELGLDEAFEKAVSLVEWPDRLADGVPDDALTLTFSFDEAEDDRTIVLSATDQRWTDILTELANEKHSFNE